MHGRARLSHKLVKCVQQRRAGYPFARMRKRIQPDEIQIGRIIDKLQGFYRPSLVRSADRKDADAIFVRRRKRVHKGVDLLEPMILVQSECAIQCRAEHWPG